MTFIGLLERQSPETLQRIASQWGRFMQRYGEIEYRAEDIPVGVGFTPDEDGAFDYACAVIVGRVDKIPAGLRRFDLPRQTYAVFEHDAHISAVHDTYLAIWDEGLGGAGFALAEAPSLEKHKPTFDTRTGMGGVEIWIPVERAAP